MLKCFLIVLFATFVISAFGPRKLYSLELPTTITSVKVIGRQIFFVGPWYIAVVDNVQWKFMQKGRMNPRIINKDIADPRMVGGIPLGTFKGDKKPYYWVATYGTNHSTGAIYVLQQTRDYSQYSDISVDAGWNYEKVQWVDMNRDGLPDCLTARFRGGIGQMLWFQQPPGQQIWGQKIIHEGMADGNFIGFIYDKKSYILIAGNQFNVLGLYWTMNRRNNWMYSRQVRFRVIDNYGKYYDVQYVDLNKDGRRDVLTTTVQISNSRGHVLAYEIPFDIQNQNWKRRVLATGFTGDYAPGKAIAYFPSKYKRQNDRPSIFLSGAGEEKLYILSPKPKNKGWGYVKAAILRYFFLFPTPCRGALSKNLQRLIETRVLEQLQAGYGMIGIPYIIDLNDDSYPEVFVPQGNHIHVFSYGNKLRLDGTYPVPVYSLPNFSLTAYYSSSAAAPPTKPPTTRSTARKDTSVYRNPFYRPTTPPPTPAIPKGALPSGRGTSSEGGSLLPSYPGVGSISAGGPQYPSRNGAPGVLAPSRNFPGPVSNPNAPGASYPNTLSQSPNSAATNPFNFGSSLNPNLPNLGATPVRQPLPPVYPPNLPAPNPPLVSPHPANSQNFPQLGLYNPTNPQQRQQFYQPAPGQGLPAANSYNSRLVQNQYGQWYQQHTPNNPFYQNRPGNLPPNEKFFASNNSFFTNTSMHNKTGNVDQLPTAPMNLILSVTKETFSFHSEAKAACGFEQRVLCDLNQLQDAEDIGGKVPEFKWGWFAVENRAATLEVCDPGEVKFDGYICHNGLIVHLPIRKQTSLPALCCSVVNWATMTKKRYSRAYAAENECKNSSRHLCSLEEMLRVWDESSYKGYQWSWFRSQKQLLRMTHACDEKQVLWPGYKCWQKKLEVTEIKSNALEKGFCCPSGSIRISSISYAQLAIIPLALFVVLLH